MAAGLGFKTFTTGEVLTSADTNGYLMQGILVFADAAARDAAITEPEEGQFAYLKDTNVTTYYTGSAWANLDTTGMTNPMTTTGDVIYSSSGSTPARLGIGTAGQVLQVNSGATAPEWAASAGGGFTYTSYSPSFTNLTVGNGSWAYAVYAQSGKMVHYIGKFDLGSTSSVSGNITISLPVTASSNMYGVYVNTIQADDNGVGDYPLLARIISPGSSFDTFAINAAGTYAHSYTGTGATVPITWSNGDQINFSIVYEAA